MTNPIKRHKWTAHAPSDPEGTWLAKPGTLGFDEVYSAWYDEVSRWIRALGGPDDEGREALVEDVFVVVRNRLRDFDGRNLPGWLYQIARRRVRAFRRLLWAKNLIVRVSPLPRRLTSASSGAAEGRETQEKRAILGSLLDRLNESERAALVLFEVEGYSGEQIAEVQGVALSTVFARVRRARERLHVLLESFEDHRS